MRCDQCNISHNTKLILFKDPNTKHSEVVRLCPACYKQVKQEMDALKWKLDPWEKVTQTAKRKR